MGLSAEDIVAQTLEPLEHLNIPAALQESLENHHSQLINLAVLLHQQGANEDTVRSSIKTVFKSYEAELIRTIVTLGNDAGHA